MGGGRAAGAADLNLLLPVVVGLGEGDPQGEVLAVPASLATTNS
jgi:hypothetical protein